MSHTEERLQELVHEMYAIAESAEWDLAPEEIRSQTGRHRMPLPDVKVLVLVAAAVILIVVGIVVANGQPRRPSTSGPTMTSTTFAPGGTVTVPDAIHQTLSEATPVFRSAGLQVTTAYIEDSLAAGVVLGQSPTGGTLVSRGSTVSLTVSSGPSALRVPSTIGLSQVQAANVLGQNDLNVGNISHTPSTSVPAGVVVGESPAAGSSVAPLSSVDLVVSTGP